MWRTTWKGLLGHKLRMALTALAIVLGTGLVSGSYVFTDTLARVFDDLFAESFSAIDVQVRSRADDALGFAFPERLDESLVGELARVDGVEQAVGGIGGLLTLVGPDGEVVGGEGPPTLGGSWSDAASPLRVREGRPPRGPGELAVDVATARRAGIEVGDEVQVLALGPAEPHLVVGLLSFAGSESFGGATLVTFDLATAQRLFGAEGEVDTVSIVAAQGLPAEQLVARLEPALPAGVEAVTAQTAAEEQLASFKEALGFLNTFLLVFGFVALFVGAFLIQNTFQIVVAQRIRELALLRAVGATQRQVTGMVLGEALLVSLAGSLVGVLVGMGLAGLIRLAFESFGDLPAAPLQLRPRTVWVAVAAGVTMTLVSAYLPARRAGRIPPVAAMREGLAPPPPGSLRRRALVGGIVTAAGAGVLAGGLAGSSPPVPGVALVGAGAGLAFVGLAILAPSFARPLGRALGAPLPRLFGPVGRLARENAVRQPRRTAATASALMIGVALVGLVTILAATIRETTDALVADRFRSDLVVQTAGFGGAGLSPELARELERAPGVATVTRIRRGPAVVEDDLTFVSGADMATIADTMRVEVLEGDLADVRGEALAVSADEASERGWEVGTEVAVEFARSGVRTFRVAAILADDGVGPDVSMGLDAWEENFVERQDASLFLRFSPGVDPVDARGRVEDVAERYPGTTVLDQTEFRDQAVAQLDAFVLLVFALLTLALVIGFVGIVNTLLLSVHERTREIGLLRAVGATRGQIRRMVTWESVIIAVFGAVLGTAVGVAFGWAVVEALGDESDLVFTLPYGQLTAAVGAAALAGVVAAVYPARRASRMRVLEAIAYE